MEFKYKAIIIISILIFIIAFFLIHNKIIIAKENYTEKLILAFNERKEIKVQDIFSFDFNRAYVFNDCYISGEGFTKRYNLGISINQVKDGVDENIGRIVFVDDLGNYVYEFKYNINQLNVLEEGIIIYPETIIERCSSTDKLLTLKFHSSQHYDY